MELDTYILPAFWASALINDDRSGLDKIDEEELNAFISRVNPGRCMGCSEESYFTRRNDAHVLPCDVLEFYFPAKS